MKMMKWWQQKQHTQSLVQPDFNRSHLCLIKQSNLTLMYSNVIVQEVCLMFWTVSTVLIISLCMNVSKTGSSDSISFYWAHHRGSFSLTWTHNQLLQWCNITQTKVDSVSNLVELTVNAIQPTHPHYLCRTPHTKLTFQILWNIFYRTQCIHVMCYTMNTNTVTNIRIMVFWNATPCSSVHRVLLKCWNLSIKTHGVTFQNTLILVIPELTKTILHNSQTSSPTNFTLLMFYLGAACL